MDDLISREAALTICQKEYEERLRMADYCGDTVAWNIGGAIKALPAVDAAPVVRCGECEMYEDGFCFSRYIGCGAVTPQRKPDDFCSYGERKEATL